MATLGSSYLNLIDMFRAQGDEATAEVVETLSRLSPVMRNAFTVEANAGTIHKHSIRTGLPAVTWGRLYQGIPQSKSGRTMVTDTTGFVEGLSTVDTRLLDISKNPAALRMQEGEAFLEAMVQETETGFFYHDVVTTPEKFRGMAARYNASGGGGAGNQIVKAGGAGSDNTSIWFVTWSEKATHLIHPQGTKAGIERQDKGEQRVTDANGNAYYVKEELFRQHIGVAVRDWRYNSRIANIDVSDMNAGNVDLYKFMRQALYKLQGVYSTAMQSGGQLNPNASVEGRTVIYMNRETLAALDALGTNSNNGALMLKPMELEGRMVQSYRGIPIEVSDAILSTESAVA
ncbi:major capsid protein [Sphingomonas turrisvirgatae]|uniref:Phage capsid protein n=1 Tax=Sphingomonas turrisvirgatae TaxID=1888892 RepID=A0A1E3LZR3_9SPHN|nr:hypothetical protein [Sphingomonas turrisvirgatae]ODP39261.1 hypothetical protein BFL28_10635 [Sphingomonas turrisvirgatae]